MSASFNNEDRGWLQSSFKQGNFSDNEINQINTVFEHDTNIDVQIIKKSLKQVKFLKRVCLYKIIMFPLEWVVILLLLGIEKAGEHSKLTNIYRDFYKDRISLATFQKAIREFN